MDSRQLASYAYHNCDFRRATAIAGNSPPGDELAAIHVKALCELDEKAAALAAAETYLRTYPSSGLLHYLLGISRYLAGQPRASIEAAFIASAEHGCAGGAMGLAFLEAAAQRYANAIGLLNTVFSDDAELEHARHLSLFQTLTLAGNLGPAEAQLELADRVLCQTPSLLRQLWGQLCWVRLLRAKGRFDGASALVERVLAQVDPLRVPRLYRNAAEAWRMIEASSKSTNLILPVGAKDGGGTGLRRQALEQVTRKPMLHSLYTFLSARGRSGATKEELVQNVWEESYNPVVHDDRIYKAIGRLRNILGDDRQAPRFLTQLGRNYVLTHPAGEPELPGDPSCLASSPCFSA